MRSQRLRGLVEPFFLCALCSEGSECGVLRCSSNPTSHLPLSRILLHRSRSAARQSGMPRPPSPKPSIAADSPGPQRIDRHEEDRQRAKKQLFCDEQHMVGKPRCTWKDLRRPRLRKFNGGSIDWNWKGSELLGHGTDGIVWKVKINDGIFALKVVSAPSYQHRRLLDTIAVLGQPRACRPPILGLPTGVCQRCSTPDDPDRSRGHFRDSIDKA